MNHDPDPPKSCIFTRFACDFANVCQILTESSIREDQDLSKRRSGRIRISLKNIREDQDLCTIGSGRIRTFGGYPDIWRFGKSGYLPYAQVIPSTARVGGGRD